MYFACACETWEIRNNVEYELYEGMTPKYLLLFDLIVIRY